MPSSVISAVHYDPVLMILRVDFVSGRAYCYKKVPIEIYKEMKNAISKGSYLNSHIKGNYEFKKINNK